MTWQTLDPQAKRDALRKLTPRQRAVFQDRLNGHSWRKIADAYGIHEATARGHWRAALDRLRAHTDQIRKAAA